MIAGPPPGMFGRLILRAASRLEAFVDSILAEKPKKPSKPTSATVETNTDIRTQYSRIEFERDVLTRLALGRSISSQDELAEFHGLHKGTVSKWLAAMEADGLIPLRKRDGKRKTISA